MAKKKSKKKSKGLQEPTRESVLSLLGHLHLDGVIGGAVMGSDLSAVAVDRSNTVLIGIVSKMKAMLTKEVGIGSIDRLIKIFEWFDEIPEFKMGKKQLVLKGKKSTFKITLMDTELVDTTVDGNAKTSVDNVLANYKSKDMYLFKKAFLSKIVNLYPMYPSEFITFASNGKKITCMIGQGDIKGTEAEESDTFVGTVCKTKTEEFSNSYNFELFTKIIKRCLANEALEELPVFLSAGRPITIGLDEGGCSVHWCLAPVEGG